MRLTHGYYHVGLKWHHCDLTALLVYTHLFYCVTDNPNWRARMADKVGAYHYSLNAHSSREDGDKYQTAQVFLRLDQTSRLPERRLQTSKADHHLEEAGVLRGGPVGGYKPNVEAAPALSWLGEEVVGRPVQAVANLAARP